jgi:N utilization substance protein A
VARDPGSRAKIAVYSRRDDIDIIGSFIGVRGSRVQSVSAELRGEKIDVMKWSPNVAELVVNALTPAKINKVIVDEENNLIEVVVAESQLSLAIGRGGQNVKLASKLLGYKIDIMTEEQESARRTAEFGQASKLFVEALDVEEMIANLLASEGFLTIEDLIESEISEIASIEGFDEDVAKEIKRRAEEYVQKTSN